MPHDESELLATRSEFPTLSKGVHLISHSLGARDCRAKARQYANRFIDEWEDGLHRVLGAALAAGRGGSMGDLIGSVLGVAPGTVCMLPNVSIAQAIGVKPRAFPSRVPAAASCTTT